MKILVSFLILLLVVGCGGSGDSSGDGDNPRKTEKDYVNWEAVPSQFSKKVEMIGFVETIPEIFETNIFGFQKDVRLKYVSDLPENSARIKIYWVWKDSVSFGRSNPRLVGNRFKFSIGGSYSCSMNIENKIVKSVEGGCIVRLEIELPQNQKTEVYNAGALISDLFYPMSVDQFLDQMDDATWDDDKKDIVTNFIYSYRQTGTNLNFSSLHLGTVIGKFRRSENKLWALQRLHNFVSDRENLEKMIEDEFYGFDRREARKIVGIR